MNRTLWMGLLCTALHLGPLQAEEAATQPAAQEEAIPAAIVHAEAVFEQYLTRTIETLAASGKARNMALAAMLLYDDSLPPALRAQQVPLWRTALDTAGGDAMVTHMVVMGYRREGETSAQDTALRQQAARLWQTLEPSNLAPMLYLDQPLESLLAQAASSVYVDLHLYELGRWIHSTLRRYPPTAQELQAFAAADAAVPEDQRLGGGDNLLAMLTVGTQYALSWPEYLRLRNACKPEELHLYPTRKPACQHVGHVMVQRSTDVLQELLGTRMLLDLSPTAHECQRLKINGSRLRWRMQRAGEWHAQDRDMGYIQHFLQDGSIQREQDAIESYLRKKKQPTEPPTDWIDPFYADLPC